MDNSIIFGPVPSRRFGLSLGINLCGDIKQCNFDCLYCELEKAKTVSKYSSYPTIDKIISCLKEALKKHKNIDVITLTANGEPTLYPFLDELIDKINHIKKDYKLLILSNGSTITDKKIRETLLKIDIVKLSLDCVSSRCFKKLDRANSSVDCENIVNFMIEFRENYSGSFVLETLFVKDINDNNNEIELLKDAYNKISPNRIDFNTVHRPPAYSVKGLSTKELYAIASKVQNQNISIVSTAKTHNREIFTKDEILTMLHLRPLSQFDIEQLFSKESKEIFQEILESNIVEKKEVANTTFYSIR